MESTTFLLPSLHQQLPKMTFSPSLPGWQQHGNGKTHYAAPPQWSCYGSILGTCVQVPVVNWTTLRTPWSRQKYKSTTAFKVYNCACDRSMLIH